jgi:hypothetical protein
MGLLDFLASPDSGNGVGGLLSYLQQPYYQPPKQDDNAALIKALQANPYEGGMPQLAPAQSVWDQPGIKYGGAPAPSVFNSGASPLASLGGYGQPSPQQPPMQAAPPQAPPMAPQPAPQAAQPPNMVPVGNNYQMPQFGAPQQAAQAPTTDISAQSRQSQPEQALPPALGGGGYFDRVHNGGSLIGSLFQNGTAQQQNLKAQYDATRQALIANGISDRQANSTALLSVLNPEAAKTILPELLTNKTELKMVKDAAGGEHPYSWNSREQTFKPVGADGETNGGLTGGFGMYAKGVSQIDSSKSGEDYLNQYSPEVKDAAKAWLRGDILPTGNARQQTIASLGKTVGIKYAADLGIPASDALYSEKRKYRTELGSNSPNTAGGQSKAFNQGISHLTALADNLEKLDNSNGLGIPVLAQGVNAIRQGVSNNQAAIADEAKSIGQTVAGEVGKLFSGSAGGGVHERELTRERFDTAKSKPQLAAALRATVETMQGGLSALEANRDRILGANSGVDLVTDDTRKNIAKIQGVIDRLDGKSGASSLPSGWSVKVR